MHGRINCGISTHNYNRPMSMGDDSSAERQRENLCAHNRFEWKCASSFRASLCALHACDKSLHREANYSPDTSKPCMSENTHKPPQSKEQNVLTNCITKNMCSFICLLRKEMTFENNLSQSCCLSRLLRGLVRSQRGFGLMILNGTLCSPPCLLY